MKYCKKCGMLLEDTHETCIRCGADVTLAENVSMYPIEVMETIEEENQRKKASGKLVAMIIGLVTVLVVLVLLFMNGLGGQVTPETKTVPEETVAAEAPPATVTEVPEAIEPTAEPEVTPEPTPEVKERKIRDDKGAYYNYIVEKDDAGNPVFTAVIPEDLTETEFYKDYEGYSNRYPFTMNYTAATKENDVRFTYLSPRELWYKVSSKGKSRVDERDLTHYMTYFKYEDPKSYLDALLKQSYPGAQFDLKEETDVSEYTVGWLGNLAAAQEKELSKKDLGDIGYIGEGTKYENTEHEYSAKMYEYEITLKDKDMLFCKYYVPSMAFHLTYDNADTKDRGDLTEWYNLAIVCFETGNEDDYDDYVDAFDVFVANALPTEEFMFINESYVKEIKKAIKNNDSPEPLSEELLAKYGKEYKPGAKLDDFDSKVMDVLRSCGPEFKGADTSIFGSDSDKVAFLDKENGKVFLSVDADEYPGEPFEELKLETRKEAPKQTETENNSEGNTEDTKAANTDETNAGSDDAASDNKTTNGGVD